MANIRGPLAAVTIFGLILAAEPSGQSELADRTAQMRFVCDTGYSVDSCRAHLVALHRVLSKLGVTVLGEWTWVLVRSERWRPILSTVGRDPDSPAFTILEKRQTFLEEALFETNPRRDVTLLAKFRMPLDRLLEHAVLHELGHAICAERDERRAHDNADQLRRRGAVTCGNGTKSRGDGRRPCSQKARRWKRAETAQKSSSITSTCPCSLASPAVAAATTPRQL